MQEQRRRLSAGTIATAAAITIVTGGTTAYLAWQQNQANQKEQPAPVAVQSAPSTPNPSEALPPPPEVSNNRLHPETKPTTNIPEGTAQAYWFKDQGAEMALEPVAVKVKGSSNAQEEAVTAALTTLLNPPPDKSMTSTIPAGTKLLGVQVKPNGIYVDLSKEFEQGGGSLSMYGRIGQVLYTATSTNPSAPVYLLLEGKPLETLGGEGLEIPQPMTRTQFDEQAGQQGE
jgi:spore germination protein GerM